MPFTTRDGVRLYWKVEGAADRLPLVLLNSIGTDMGLWDRALPHLLPASRNPQCPAPYKQSLRTPSPSATKSTADDTTFQTRQATDPWAFPSPRAIALPLPGRRAS